MISWPKKLQFHQRSSLLLIRAVVAGSAMRGWKENPKDHFKERKSEVAGPSEAAVAETIQREKQFEHSKSLIKRHLFGNNATEKDAIISVSPSSPTCEASDGVADGNGNECEEVDYGGQSDVEDDISKEEEHQETQKDLVEDESQKSAVAEDSDESLPPLKRVKVCPEAKKKARARSCSLRRKEKRENTENTEKKRASKETPNTDRSRGNNDIVGQNQLGTSTIALDLQSSLIRRSSINVEGSGSREDLERCRNERRGNIDVSELPASVGSSNIMIANWAVGRDASPLDLGRILAAAPFDCIVIVLTTAVAENDSVATFLTELVNSRPDFEQGTLMHPFLTGILAEKAVYRMFPKAYVAIHRAKVKGFTFVESSLPGWSTSTQSGSSTQPAVAELAPVVKFGTLSLHMDQTRQRLDEIRIGIVDMRYGFVSEMLFWAKVDAMVEWISSDRVAVLTGHFGHSDAFVKEVAMKANAISSEPLAQWLNVFLEYKQEWRTLTFPNYFLCFGYYRTIRQTHEHSAVLPHGWKFGEDLWYETRPTLPTWPRNDKGSPFVPNHGAIKMKHVNFDRWVEDVFQTCLWMGTSTPSKSSQEKQRCRSRGSSSKGKKEKGKGKGKIRK
jgi:hypothetical protein